MTAEPDSRFGFEETTRGTTSRASTSMKTTTKQQRTRRIFVVYEKQSGFFSFFFPTRRLVVVDDVVFVLFSSLPRDREGYVAEVDGGRLVHAARERETIPVEEGPFCPAHPTRGFRRPWSH